MTEKENRCLLDENSSFLKKVPFFDIKKYECANQFLENIKRWPIKEFEPAACGLPNRGLADTCLLCRCNKFKPWLHGQSQEKKTPTTELILLSSFF